MVESCLVTGAAGFIGSHLSEKLVTGGFRVIGIDSFTNYYPRERKLQNLSALKREENFVLIEGDLVSIDLQRIVKDIDYVFHLAAQPGVRPSWGETFSEYVHDNIIATQRLLEAIKESKIRKFVFASSSSVYGDTEKHPTDENSVLAPNSPYGVTKLAGENLCHTYYRNFGVPMVALRYFTVYGPRQRPDMAFSRFIRQISAGEKLEVYGDGKQTRDFTYCDDAIAATVLAMQAKPGRIYNVGGGNTVTINEAIRVIENETGRRANVLYAPKIAGDVHATCANISRMREELGYFPRTRVSEGLGKQVEWQLHAELPLGLKPGDRRPLTLPPS